MAARDGMTDLVGQLRRLVDDAGTASFSDDRLQTILDQNRRDFYQDPLIVTPQQIASGTVGYFVYNSRFQFVEGTASGTAAFRLYDSLGTVLTSGYTFEPDRGKITFTTSQAGSARYLDGRSFDIYAAAADAWRERAAMQADSYTFRVEGRSYNRSDWFRHCMQMVDFYASQARPTQATMERGDMVC